MKTAILTIFENYFAKCLENNQFNAKKFGSIVNLYNDCKSKQ